jgi:hypothetical protein
MSLLHARLHTSRAGCPENIGLHVHARRELEVTPRRQRWPGEWSGRAYGGAQLTGLRRATGATPRTGAFALTYQLNSSGHRRKDRSNGESLSEYWDWREG